MSGNDEGMRRLVPDTVAAPILGVAVQTMRNWRWYGEGPSYVRVGDRAIRYDLADLEAFIKAHRISPYRRVVG